MRTTKPLTFDDTTLNVAGIISENCKNQNTFISDMTNQFGLKPSGEPLVYPESRNIQYGKIHAALMELNFFGKIIPECDFILFNILNLQKLQPDTKLVDCYYLDVNWVPSDTNGMFLCIPKGYNSQSKEKITILEINQKFGDTISKTEFYFPFINNVFKLMHKNSDDTYIELFKYLINYGVLGDYRKTKISKQYVVHPTLSYNKIKL